MKVGIYLSGLGQSFSNESAEKYVERLKNEIKINSVGTEYEVKKEKVKYTDDKESTIYSICEKNESGKIIYKLYDFKYHEILTSKFNSYSLILKNLWLFLLVARKFPLIFTRIFFPASYSRPLQTLYVFFIFLILAVSILIMLPATVEVILLALKELDIDNIQPISNQFIERLSLITLPLTTILILIVPNANTLISNLATEFICANDYMKYGAQKSVLQGNLELLVDYISENETDCKIHFHAYSFGTILALDYIYPYGNTVSKNAEQFCEAIITIGTPFEFVKSYYPRFYENRKTELGDKLQWLNVYSISDALATNFRKDAKIGDAQFGIQKESLKPFNLNYETAAPNKIGIIDFFMLHSIKVHGMYWDERTEGKSCLSLVYSEMTKRNLIEL